MIYWSPASGNSGMEQAPGGNVSMEVLDGYPMPPLIISPEATSLPDEKRSLLKCCFGNWLQNPSHRFGSPVHNSKIQGHRSRMRKFALNYKINSIKE